MATTDQLLQQISTKSISDEKARTEIETLIATMAGARGFFVTLLTGETALAEDAPQFLLLALTEHKEIVGDLLTKNIVMATTMKIVHERNHDLEAAKGSLQVITRTQSLLRQLAQNVAGPNLLKMQSALEDSLGESGNSPEDNDYRAFLLRWQYDDEQKRQALAFVKALIAPITQ